MNNFHTNQCQEHFKRRLLIYLIRLVRGILTELHKILWTDEYTYTTITTDTNGIKLFESTSYLSKDFRDNKGEYKSYENREIIGYEKYSDIFDKNEQLIKAEFMNLMENKNYVVLQTQ